MKEIKSKVQKLANVKWRELKPIQQENFKELTKEAYKKLRQSLLNNDFISPFAVWQEKGGAIYTIDGVHRQKVLLELEHEGFEIPPTLPAVFIDCANRKDAAKMLLVYSSAYARTTDEGLYEFLNMEGLNFDELKLEIDIPSINEMYFRQDEIEGGTTLCEEYLIPPFSVFDTRQGYWQERKRAWLSLGIKAELGRGGGLLMQSKELTTENLNYYRNRK